MSWNTGLAGSALNVAQTDEKRLRVVAGPGTGKSFALMRRVARLLEEGQEPSRVLAVTFTRNAAASLVQDLSEIGVTGCEKVNARTLHSFCFSLLNREEVFTYLNRTPRPVITFPKAGSLQFEASTMLSDLIQEEKKFGGKRDCTKRIRAFEAAWARLQSQQPGWPQDSMDQLFEQHLIAWLRFHNAMLIGELVPEALRYLRNNPMSNALIAFDHVIVDEYQDLNRAEQEVVDLLAGNDASAIVGDPDQSIYSFRHANPEGIDDFSNRHSTTYDEHLTECRRCPTRVVTLADHLIGHNYLPGTPSRLRAMPSNNQGEVHIVQWRNPDEEIQGISDYVDHLLSVPLYDPKDILILTPRRPLAYRIRDAISGNGRPVHSFYQEEALENEAAQRALALLTLLNDPDDRVALRWWLGHRSQNGRSGAYRRLRQHCEDTGSSPEESLESVIRGDLKLPGITSLLKPFNDLKKITERLSKLTLTDLVEQLLPDANEGCAILRDVAVRGVENSKTLGELFDHITTYITQPEVPEGDFVRIMSPQKSKGLTSKVVIVTSCVEGLLPLVDTSLSVQEQEESVREQRRLFYVAITRCTDILVISSITGIEYGPAKAMGIQVNPGFGRFGRTITSRFINELGPTAPYPKSGYEWQNSVYDDPVVP